MVRNYKTGTDDLKGKAYVEALEEATLLHNAGASKVRGLPALPFQWAVLAAKYAHRGVKRTTLKARCDAAWSGTPLRDSTWHPTRLAVGFELHQAAWVEPRTALD
jgi:hypothetical protein